MLNCEHRVVDEPRNVRLLTLCLEATPPGFPRYPKDVLSCVLITIFQEPLRLISANAIARQFICERATTCFESV